MTEETKFSTRLAAWWHGYDADEYANWKAQQEGDPDAPDYDETVVVPHDVAKDPEPDDDPDLRWPPNRLAMTQKLFGRGYTFPGGEKGVVSMVKPLGLAPENSFVDFSVGLGGPGTTLVERFGIWVTGFEMDEELVAAAKTTLKTLKGGERVKVSHFDPASSEMRPRAFDNVLCLDALYRTEEKTRAVDLFKHVAKDWGSILFTDLVKTSDAPPSKKLKAWMEGTGHACSFWRKEQYEELLRDLQLDVRVVEDISKSKSEQVRDSFKDFLAAVKESGGLQDKPKAKKHLMKEAEHWARLASLLESGELANFRFFAIKRGEADG